ncbi:MAG: DUF4435 domain-containing protein [Prevotella sp.]|nr:DUF4435 domain-containing protein [Prevotella sp.]
MKRLKDNITAGYVTAANKLASKNSRRKIVAYVESYDDIFFWRTVLSRFENEKRYFEVMLPTREKLERGKKSALMNVIGENVGPDMIACVDADYDYLLQGSSPTSKKILESPYVFHTIVYAIENYQCYAESLNTVAVMVTLNDHRIFDFVTFMRGYSEAIFPLFVWSVMLYRSGEHSRFSISDFNTTIDLGGFSLQNPEECIEHLRGKCIRKVRWLQQRFPGRKQKYLDTRDDLKRLGVTPQETYLYIQGHHLFDAVVAPVMTKVCNRLRMERESEISRTAVHRTQMHNELSCYENSLADTKQMLKKNMGYMQSPQFLQLQKTIEERIGRKDTPPPSCQEPP